MLATVQCYLKNIVQEYINFLDNFTLPINLSILTIYKFIPGETKLKKNINIF